MKIMLRATGFCLAYRTTLTFKRAIQTGLAGIYSNKKGMTFFLKQYHHLLFKILYYLFYDQKIRLVGDMGWDVGLRKNN